MPVLGGRRVRPLAAIVPAALGALVLTAIWLYAFRDFPGMDRLEFSHVGWKGLLVACYLPLLAWGPLLGAVTYGYYRWRCRD
jgi:ABC-type Na+ efflux pump permease subunit